MSAHLDDMTILFLSSPKCCTACWPSYWGAFRGNYLTVQFSKSWIPVCFAMIDVSFRSKQRPSEKPYSYTSDCLTLVVSDVLVSNFLLTWVSMREKDRLTGSHVSVMLFCSVPIVQGEHPANTWSWYQNVTNPLIKHQKGRFYSYVNG